MVKTRKHRGGATYAYTGPAGVSAGVPYESRVSINDHCMSQRGGSCGCGQRQLGGSGGYSFDFGNNALGKVYAALPTGACPQRGGSDHELREISSSRAGYGFGPAGVVSTESAHYLDPTHKGGSRKKSRSKSKKTKNSRKNRKTKTKSMSRK